MMADDTVVRVLCGKNKKQVLEALTNWVSETVKSGSEQTLTIEAWWKEVMTILANASKEEIEMKGRMIMTRLVDIVQGSLLIADFQSDHDQVAKHVMESWFLGKSDNGKLIAETTWREQARSDMKIVFGQADLSSDRARL